MIKSLSFIVIAWMLIGVVSTSPFKVHADGGSPMIDELGVKDAGFQFSGMTGSPPPPPSGSPPSGSPPPGARPPGGPGGPGGPPPPSTTQASG